MRFSTDAHEREERLASIDPPRIGQPPVVVPASIVDVVANAGAKQRASDRTRVRHDPWSERERTLAS